MIRMTSTYNDEWGDEEKIAEELRLIRCCLERLLRHFATEEFVDYQMEKFVGSPSELENLKKKTGG